MDISSAASTEARVQTLALGVNVLYWIDDDSAWDQGGLRRLLGELPITTLRFPGGEVSDNFDWARTALERPQQYPFEADSGQGRARRLDYRDFLRHARALRVADIFFVVNLEGAFFAPGDPRTNVLRHARKAAAWVAAVRRRGYRVTHWEIGNESYLRETSYPLTAAEYAEAVSVFYREMKQADPGIRIGVHGPVAPDAAGFADRMTPEQRRYFRGRGARLCAELDAGACLDAIRKVFPGRSHGAPWWDVLLREAPSFDFVAVHRYAMANTVSGNGQAYEFAETDRLHRLRKRLEEAAGRRVDIAITEWNVPYRASKQSGAHDAGIALHNLVKLGDYLAAGVSHAHLWPVSFPENDRRALLRFRHGEPTANYRALQAAAPILSGRFVRQVMLGGGVYMLHTRSDAADNLMLINRATREVRVALPGRLLRVRQLSGASLQETEACVTGAGRMVEVSLPGGSLTIAAVKRADRPTP